MASNTQIPELFFKDRKKMQNAAAAANNTTTTTTKNVTFDAIYLAVDEEYQDGEVSMTDHERQLLMEYKSREGEEGASDVISSSKDQFAKSKNNVVVKGGGG